MNPISSLFNVFEDLESGSPIGKNQNESARINVFSQFALLVSTPFVVFFMVLNLIEGDLKEALLCFMGVFLLVAGFWHMRNVSASLQTFRLLYGCVSMILLAGVCIQAGEGTILFWLFATPLLYFTMFGKREGLVWAVVTTVVTAIVLFVPAAFLQDWYSPAVGIRFMVTFGFVLVLSYGTEASRDYLGEKFRSEHVVLLEKKKNLELALAELKLLSGILPICAKCKKIHNEKNEWQDVAEYVRDHSEADFSHGICPDCVGMLYPDQTSDKLPD